MSQRSSWSLALDSPVLICLGVGCFDFTPFGVRGTSWTGSFISHPHSARQRTALACRALPVCSEPQGLARSPGGVGTAWAHTWLAGLPGRGELGALVDISLPGPPPQRLSASGSSSERKHLTVKVSPEPPSPPGHQGVALGPRASESSQSSLCMDFPASPLPGQPAFLLLLALAHLLATCIPGTRESLLPHWPATESSVVKFVPTFILVTTVTDFPPTKDNCC